MKSGDLIGFSGFGLTSIAINLATAGLPFVSLSHVGILAEHQGELLLFEATKLSDQACVIQKKKVEGTQAVELHDRLRTYSGRAWHYPLYRPLYADERIRLNEHVASLIGKSYDTREAMESAGCGPLARLLSRLRIFDSQAALFCAEFVSGSLSTVGIMPTDDPAKWNPNRLVRHLRRSEILLRPKRLK